MPHPTDAQIEAAIAKLRAIIEAAENSNHAGEVALMKAANAGELFEALRGLRVKGNLSGVWRRPGWSDWLRRAEHALRTAHPFYGDGPSDDDLPTAADLEDRRQSEARSLSEAGRGHLIGRGR